MMPPSGKKEKGLKLAANLNKNTANLNKNTGNLNKNIWNEFYLFFDVLVPFFRQFTMASNNSFTRAVTVGEKSKWNEQKFLLFRNH